MRDLSRFRRRSHALTSLTRIALLGIRRSKHCDTITPISISTMFSQLACFADVPTVPTGRQKRTFSATFAW